MTGRFYRNRGTIWEKDKSLSLEEVENRLNELSTENRHLKDVIKRIEYSNDLKERHMHKAQMDYLQYKQKVKGSLTKFHREYKTMRQMLGANKLVLDKYIDLIKEIADELGVELE